jgi:hypothetical protein
MNLGGVGLVLAWHDKSQWGGRGLMWQVNRTARYRPRDDGYPDVVARGPVSHADAQATVVHWYPTVSFYPAPLSRRVR